MAVHKTEKIGSVLWYKKLKKYLSFQDKFCEQKYPLGGWTGTFATIGLQFGEKKYLSVFWYVDNCKYKIIVTYKKWILVNHQLTSKIHVWSHI